MVEFRQVNLTEEYSKTWNESCRDFIKLYKDGIMITDTLYRIGGFGHQLKDGYFMLIKYTEDYYDDIIVKNIKQKKHLKGQWCILNALGEEKIVFEQFKSPYLRGGLIYSLDNKFYNIETNESYSEISMIKMFQNGVF